MAGRDNLRPPIQPGEVRNPEGRNQYSYRRDAERQFSELLAKEARKRPLSEQVINRVIQDAIAGKPHAQRLVLERILPATSKVEANVSTDAVIPVERFNPDTDWERKFEALLADRRAERSGNGQADDDLH